MNLRTIGWLPVLVVALFAGAFLSSCSPADEEADGIVVGRPADVATLDPHASLSAPCTQVVSNVIETLVYLDEDLELHPRLAESWEWVSDTKLRFHLREGVQFHDGEPFNAEAVKFSIERVLDPDAGLPGRGSISSVTSIEVVDEYTVDIMTDVPYVPLLRQLSVPYSAGIVSPKAVRELGDDFAASPVGTGPFTVEEWSRDDYVLLHRFEQYWGQQAEVAWVKFVVTPEESVRLMSLKTGEADMITNPPAAELADLREDPDYVVHEVPGIRIFFAGMVT
ncbi:MAG: ABC transporter substrate-binding protein, partial [Bacillota bacterium]